MPKNHLIVDKTEIIVTILMGKQWRNIPVTADKIRRIQFEKCVEKKFFLKSDSECIKIETSNSPMPITIYKSKEKAFFDSYKESLAKFAKDNKLTFSDSTKE